MSSKAVATRRTKSRICSAALAVTLRSRHGGGSSAIVLRRETGGMWAGAGSPRGSCDTPQVLCDAHERALPGWLAFN